MNDSLPYIARLHLAATYALVTLGTTGLWLGEPSSRVLPYPILTALAAILAFIFTDRPNGFQLPVSVCNLLAVVILGIIAVEFSYDGVASVVAMAHFLVYLQIVKFFRRKSDQDLWQLYGLNLLQLAIACVLNRQMTFGFLLAGYTALGVLTLMLFHLRRLQSDPQAAAPWSLKMLIRPWLWATATVLPIALAIFWMTPRAGQPTAGANIGGERESRQLTTGFSPSLELNEMQRVLENRDVVFNVWANGPDGKRVDLPNNVLWRGQVFVSYLNNSWKVAPDQSFIRSWDRNAEPLPGQVKLRIQQVVPTRDVLFSPKPLFWARTNDPQADIEFVAHEGRLRYRRIGMRDNRSPRDPINYSLIVGLGAEFYRDAEWRSPSAEYLRLARQKPPNIDRVLELAKQLCAEVPPSDVQAKIQKLTSYFEHDGGYAYTLDLDAEDRSLDRLEDFVFNRKRGHCEYFATALAVMLRAVDVPTRVVTGFKGADYNETGAYYQVRELLAHSWVEAYIESEDRWQSLDPSPNDLRQQVVDENRSPWQRLWEMADAASNAWTTHFVGYSNMEQREALMAMARDLWELVNQALANLFIALPQNFFRWSFWTSFRGVFALATAAFLLWLLRKGWLLGKRFQRRTGAFQRRPSTWPLFRDWNRLVSQLGFQRRPAETPREFAVRVEEGLNSDARLAGHSALHRAVVDAFYAARYGGRDAPADALSTLKEDLRAFRLAVD
jgi:protein-glutamine gamma-glutamyltransferase